MNEKRFPKCVNNKNGRCILDEPPKVMKDGEVYRPFFCKEQDYPKWCSGYSPRDNTRKRMIQTRQTRLI